jgi:hypothetical protein
METTPTRVLVVADRRHATAALVHAVRRRAAVGACEFTLMVPAVARGLHRVVDPEDACCEEAEETIARLLPDLEAAAGTPVAARIGSHEVLAAVEDAINDSGFAEVIVSSGSTRVARLLHVDLPRKIAALGTAVSVDLHALLELVERGCPPRLAARILAPIGSRSTT